MEFQKALSKVACKCTTKKMNFNSTFTRVSFYFWLLLWFLFPFSEVVENPDQPCDVWSLQLQNASCFIFPQPSDRSSDYWNQSYFEMWQKYTQMMVHVVSTSSAPQAGHDHACAEDKSFHQIPLSIHKVLVEGVRVSCSQTPTCFLRDGTAKTRAQTPNNSPWPLLGT